MRRIKLAVPILSPKNGPKIGPQIEVFFGKGGAILNASDVKSDTPEPHVLQITRPQNFLSIAAR